MNCDTIMAVQLEGMSWYHMTLVPPVYLLLLAGGPQSARPVRQPGNPVFTSCI